MGRGRKTGPSQRPEAIGAVTGWWFAWQAHPNLLADGATVYRKSVYRRSTGSATRMKRLKKNHRREWGEWCEGVPELGHEAHWLSKSHFLTVDHIVPLRLGGSHERSNLRVVCNWANLQLERSRRRRAA